MTQTFSDHFFSEKVLAIFLGSEHFITLYYILDPICSQQRAADLSKTAGNCCKGNICACTAEKEYHDICLEQLSLSF